MSDIRELSSRCLWYLIKFPTFAASGQSGVLFDHWLVGAALVSAIYMQICWIGMVLMSWFPARTHAQRTQEPMPVILYLLHT